MTIQETKRRWSCVADAHGSYVISYDEGEFEKLTGLQVGPEVYHLVECVYMNSPQLDKQAFCEQYKGNIGFSNLLNLVEQELVELQRRVEETDAVMSQELVSKDAKIKSLEEKLDKELEWKLTKNTGTNLPQFDEL